MQTDRELIADERVQGIFRVRRLAMTAPEVLALEREQIFDRCWLYVGHESEVPHPGDYRRRSVGGRPIFFVRGGDGHVRVFLNTCLHRGAMVCRRDEGNAEIFQCFYHAWTYNNRGDLIGIPDEDGYSRFFEKAERALRVPARVESYRGFIFLSFNPAVTPLDSYLGDAGLFLDLLAEHKGGRTVVLPGTLKYSIRTNWKLLIENSIDGYHFPATHQSFAQYLASIGVSRDRDDTQTWGIALGNGHSAFGVSTGGYVASPQALSTPVSERIVKLRQKLGQRYGEGRENWLPGYFNLLIYPNLVIITNRRLPTVRTMWPVAPDLVEVTAWVLGPEEGCQDLHAALDEYHIFQGPGGFGTPDDVEALESCQTGFGAAREVEWSDISRGMHRLTRSNDELQMRAFWRQWSAQISGLEGATDWDDLGMDAVSRL